MDRGRTRDRRGLCHQPLLDGDGAKSSSAWLLRRAVICTPRTSLDNATPSANSTAPSPSSAWAALTGERQLPGPRKAVVAQLVGASPVSTPPQSPHLLAAVDLIHAGATEVAVGWTLPELVRAVQTEVPAQRRPGLGRARTDSPLWEGRRPGRAYVCRDYVCQAPVTDPDAVADSSARRSCSR